MTSPLLQRLAPTHLGAGWHKTLNVPADHRALLYNGHDYQGTLGPGEHTLDTRLARLHRLGEDKRLSAVLLREGPWPLELDLHALVEDTPATAALRISLAISDPPLLVTELLGAREQLSAEALSQRLAPTLHHCLQPLTDDPQCLAARIAAELAVWLGDWGLRLAAVPEVRLPDAPAHRQAVQTLQRQHTLDLQSLHHRLDKQKLEADFQRGERIADAQTDAQISDIQRGQAQAELGLEAEREKLWRERLEFLVALDQRWR